MGKLTKLQPRISQLEPRILFDGAALATAVDVLDNTSFVNEEADVPPVTEPLRDKNEIAFVDSGIEGYEDIINDLDPSIEVHILDASSDGLEQIASILEGRNGIDALHIISHGSVGEISLGSSQLDSQNLSSSSLTLQTIGNSLNDNGDILLYGCSVAENGQGQDFVDSIAELTSADVAASDDITGSSSLGGDWDLEYTAGIIESQTIESLSFSGELAAQSVSGLNDISIADDSTDIKINPDIAIQDGGNYGDGYIDFEVGSGLESGDTLVLTSTTGNVNDVGEISIVGSDVYLGRGGSTTLIGTVDATKNGLNGEALRINFLNITIEDLSIVTNGDFSQALTNGWTPILDRVDLGSPLPGTVTIATPDGIATPTDAQVTYPIVDPADLIARGAIQPADDNGSVSGYNHGDVDPTKDAIVEIEAGKLKLTERNMLIDSFGIIHGSAAYSDTFSGSTGMVLKFDWEANKISDDYHVVGYLVENTTNEITIVLDSTGGTGSGTATAIIPSAGNYRFVFVSGTFDKTGFRAAGASMFIDNIRVERPLVVDAVLQKLATQVEYSNLNPSVNKVLTVSTQNVLGTQANSSLNLILTQEKAPIIPQTISTPKSIAPTPEPLIGEPEIKYESRQEPIKITPADKIETQYTPKVPGVDIKHQGLIRSTDVTLNVDENGNISFDDTVESVDFRLQKINFTNGKITIDIRDDYASDHERYSGSYANGEALPNTLKIDRYTGSISGTIPKTMLDEDGNVTLEISAYNSTTNETRILKIKINVKDLQQTDKPTSPVSFIPLNEQFAQESNKLNNYGNNLTKLFTSET